MIVILKVLLTLLCALIVGTIFFKLGIPGGMLVGALFGVGVFSVTTELAYMPYNIKIVSQIVIGAYIGCLVKREDLKRFPHIIVPFLIIMVTFFILNIVVGLIVYHTTPLDLKTSLLCVMAGGVGDTPLIAMDMGADASKVATMQFVRLVTGLGFIPSIVVIVDNISNKISHKNAVKCDNQLKGDKTKRKKEKKKLWGNPKNTDFGALLVTLMVAIVGGVIGKISGLPAGSLLFSAIATAILKVNWQRAQLPTWCRRCAQILTGCCVGATIHEQDIIELKYLIYPAVLMMITFVINCIVVGKILSKVCNIEYREGMLYVLPAGASEMALVAEDMGIASPDIGVIQVFRLMLVMAIFPQFFVVLDAIIT